MVVEYRRKRQDVSPEIKSESAASCRLFLFSFELFFTLKTLYGLNMSSSEDCVCVQNWAEVLGRGGKILERKKAFKHVDMLIDSIYQ